MMRQMLSSLQESPVIAMAVLVLFAGMFGYILFQIFRKKNKKAFKDASQMPLEEQEKL